MDASEFEQHPLWVEVERCLRGLEDLPEPSAEDIERGQTLQFRAAYTKSFQEVGPGFFSPAMLEDVRSVWHTVADYVDSHNANPASGHLNEALRQSDAVLALLGMWP